MNKEIIWLIRLLIDFVSVYNLSYSQKYNVSFPRQFQKFLISHVYFLCPSLGSLMKRMIVAVSNDRMAAMMNVARSAEE